MNKAQGNVTDKLSATSYAEDQASKTGAVAKHNPATDRLSVAGFAEDQAATRRWCPKFGHQRSAKGWPLHRRNVGDKLSPALPALPLHHRYFLPNLGKNQNPAPAGTPLTPRPQMEIKNMRPEPYGFGVRRVIALFDVVLTEHLHAHDIALRELTAGTRRIASPRNRGRHCLSFHPVLATAITAAASTAFDKAAKPYAVINQR